MHKVLRKLSLAIKDQNIDDTITNYCSLINNDIPQNYIVKSVVKDVIPILYRNIYFKVPHGIMGLVAALDVAKHIGGKYSDIPLGQALCYLASENKLAPLNFSAYQPYYNDNNDHISAFKTYVRKGDIPLAYRYFLGLKAKDKVDAAFFSEMFTLALEDIVNLGHKAIYLHKILELVEFLDEEPANVFYPIVSYLVSEPKDFTFKDIAQKEYDILKSENINFEANNRALNKEESYKITDTVVNSLRTTAIKHISDLLREGVSIQSISDNLMVSAAQLVLNTDRSDWIKPLHCFNYCYAINSWLRKYNGIDRVFVLYMQALFVNQVFVTLKKVDFRGAAVYIKHRCILSNIINSIRNSNVSDTTSLTESYILSGCDVNELISKLAIVAVQNDSIKNFVHDMKFTSSCINEYKENKSPLSWMILVAWAKHLSQSSKEYNCYRKFQECLYSE